MVGVSTDDPDGDIGRCLQHVEGEHGFFLGVPFQPVGRCEEVDTHLGKTVANGVRECRLRGGKMKTIRLDLLGYAQRSHGEKDLRQFEREERVRKFEAYLRKTMDARMLLDLANGVGVCLPPSCSTTNGLNEGVPAIILRFFAPDEWDNDQRRELPPLQRGSDVHVTEWTCQAGEGRKEEEAADNEEPDAREAQFGEALRRAEEEERDEGSIAPLLNGTGFRTPWWLSCEGPGSTAEWRRWARALREGFGGGVTMPSEQLAVMANELVQKHLDRANYWAQWADITTERTRRLEYVHFNRSELNRSHFDPFQYFDKGTDFHWLLFGNQGQPVEAADFCPYGYIMALYIRVLARWAAKRDGHAAPTALGGSYDIDVQKLIRMLGGSSVADFLEVTHWRVRARDIEMLELRDAFAAHEAPIYKRTPVSGYCIDGDGNEFDQYRAHGSLDDCKVLCNSIRECVGLTYKALRAHCIIHTADEAPTYNGTWLNTNKTHISVGKPVNGNSNIDDAQCYILDESRTASPATSQTEGLTFAAISPRPLKDPLNHFAWHALKLNAHVRFLLDDGAKGARVSVPALTLFTDPPHLSIFIVPMLERIWGGSLRLGIFNFFGPWQNKHEKCDVCMRRYQQRYVLEASLLLSLPLTRETELGKRRLHVDWTRTNYPRFLATLRGHMERHPRALSADVVLCTASLWLCTALRAVSPRPVLTLCLVGFFSFAPPDLKRDYATLLESASDLYARQLASALTGRGQPPRGLLVREDLYRGYGNPAMMEVGTFHPFVALPSIYITARAECREHYDVLVMREGSRQRFQTRMRGLLLLSTLLQFETPSSPWRFRILSFSKERLSYEDLGRHRAVLWLPLVAYGKMTFKDLITMEIPIFAPDAAMMASIAAQGNWHACSRISTFYGEPHWAYTLCRETKIAYWLPLMPLYRYPHVVYFESLTDLVLKLAKRDCDDFRLISARMSLWNAAAVVDDAAFWRSAVLSLHAWSAAPESGDDEDAEVSSKMGAATEDSIQMPRGPPEWIPGKTCGPLAMHCRYSDPDDLAADPAAPPAFIDQETPASGEYECCADAFLMEHGPIEQSEPTVGVPTAHGCLADAAMCSDKLLRYGVHLSQRLPPAD